MRGPPRNRKAGISVRTHLYMPTAAPLDKEKPKRAGINLQIRTRSRRRKDGESGVAGEFSGPNFNSAI